MPLPDRFWQEVRPVPKINFVCCYPRSGSRWVREVLSFAAAELIGEEQFTVYRQVHGEPDSLARKALNRHVLVNAHDCPHLIQSERPEIIPVPVYRSHNLEQIASLRTDKVLYLYRHPAAVMNSFFHFLRPSRAKKHYSKSLEAFCDHKLQSWIGHMQEAIDFHEREPERIRFFRYADESPFSVDQLVEISRFLDLPFSRESITAAHTRLGELFQEMNKEGESPHIRGSNVGVGQIYEPEFLELVLGRTKSVLEAADAISKA